MKSQYQKILALHKEQKWVCGNAYRAEFIFSPHKRRQEMVEMEMCKSFNWKPCEHGYKNVRDYEIILANEPKQKLPPQPSRQTSSTENTPKQTAMPFVW